MTIARPEIAVTNVDELFADRLGQLWSPATIRLTWPATADLRAPSVQVEVIAHSHSTMTAEQLKREHLRAAHDVLTAALLALESSFETGPSPPRPPKPVDRTLDKKGRV